MKSLTISELDNLVDFLQTLVGSRLQEIVSTSTAIALGLWKREGLVWILIDLNPATPSLIVFDEDLPNLKKKTTPLLLFLRSHFLGRFLKAATRPIHLGRALVLEFNNESLVATLECRLFPHGQNLIAKADGRGISWHKVKPLNANELTTNPDLPLRSILELKRQWLLGFYDRKDKYSVERKTELFLEKKKFALQKAKQDLERKLNLRWRDAGNWLKANLNDSTPEDFLDYIDQSKSITWNIENCFRKAKEVEEKIASTRVNIALQEASLLELTQDQEKAKNIVTKMDSYVESNQLKKLKVEGQRSILSDNLEFYRGKSAVDNLKLLRAAKPWDYWLHLRDYPGAHGIIHRNKKQVVSIDVFQRAGRLLIEAHLKHKTQTQSGYYDVVVTECRFVRPIKGDQLGRVTFTNEQVLTVKFPL